MALNATHGELDVCEHGGVDSASIGLHKSCAWLPMIDGLRSNGRTETRPGTTYEASALGQNNPDTNRCMTLRQFEPRCRPRP